MGRKRWIDKKSASTFTLVHRAPEDDLYYDNDAPTGVFVEVEDLNSKDLKEARKHKYGSNPNAGEAAKYGIYLDDSNYDYTQHLATIGEDPDAVFVPAKKPGQSSGDDGVPGLPSWLGGPPKDGIDYQKFMDVPDAIAGFKPDMDPRLREVLEALDDEAYIEEQPEVDNDEDNDEDDGFFSELVKGGEMKDEKKWERTRPKEELVQKPDEEDWHFAFRKFKLEQEQSRPAEDEDDDGGSDIDSNFGSDFELSDRELDDESRDTLGELTGPSLKHNSKTKKKKRVGAKTDLSGYSMSSSANFRNAGLQLLDDRFDKIEEEYEKVSDDEEEGDFDITKERSDFESILDDFLANDTSRRSKRR